MHVQLLSGCREIKFGVILHVSALCVHAVKALRRLCGCASLSELSLLTDAISNKIPCAGPNVFLDHPKQLSSPIDPDKEIL